jgi:hypothetical protein
MARVLIASSEPCRGGGVQEWEPSRSSQALTAKEPTTMIGYCPVCGLPGVNSCLVVMGYREQDEA